MFVALHPFGAPSAIRAVAVPKLRWIPRRSFLTALQGLLMEENAARRHPCGFSHKEGHPCSSVTIGGSPFKDMLASRRTSSDLLWATQTWVPSEGYRNGRKVLKPSEVADLVLESQRVRETIAQDAREKSLKEEEILLRSQNLLKEMHHNQEMVTVRFFAVVLSKLVRRIFCHVYVNREGIEKVREVLPTAPTVFLPTHRSYADFLLVSFLNYSYHLPLPVIAAAMDFTGMSGVGELLRRSGAFFIKRNVRDDSLYRLLLVEYVQAILKAGNQPLEFFIEGTRSRTSKSLSPKIGMLAACIELYVRGEIPDLNLVPISTTYDRTMEEKLYAYELLGIPKPKESTSGLFKGLSVLSESHGNAYITLGTPISVRELLSDPKWSRGKEKQRSVIRSLHADALTRDEMKFVESAALAVEQRHALESVVPLFSLVAASLAKHGVKVDAPGVRMEQVVQDVEVLRKLMTEQGFAVSHEVTRESMSHSLAVHSNLVECIEENGVAVDLSRVSWESLLTSVLKLKAVHALDVGLPQDGRVGKGHPLKQEVLYQAVPRIMVQLCTNSSLHAVFRPFLLLLAVTRRSRSDAVVSTDVLKADFAFLMSIMRLEFIHDAAFVSEDFDASLELLRRWGLVEVTEGYVKCVTVTEEHQRIHQFAETTMRPYIHGYCVLARMVVHEGESTISSAELLKAYQARLEEIYLAEEACDLSSLILDLASNAVKSFRELGGLQSTGPDTYHVYVNVMERIAKDIGRFFPDNSSFPVPPKSKL